MTTPFYITPHERAFLDTVASTESPGYNVMYGFGTFDDFSDHPRQYNVITSGPNKGKKSSAAGRYQFLASTWDRIAHANNLPDFSPASQDKAAVILAREDYNRKTGRNLSADLASGDPAILAGVGKALSSTWTSLPSGIEQGQNADRFVTTFNAALGNPSTHEAGTELSHGMTPTGLSHTSMMSKANASAGEDMAYHADVIRSGLGDTPADPAAKTEEEAEKKSGMQALAPIPDPQITPFTPLTGFSSAFRGLSRS